jgi:hypothetical protein
MSGYQERDAVRQVDEAVQALTERGDFRAALPEARKARLGQLLLRLTAERLISNVLFDPSLRLFSFTYRDGSLGGVSLREHHPEANGDTAP